MFTFDHVGIAVTDCDKSARFYSDVFRAEAIGSMNSDMLEIRYMNIGGQLIELLQYKNDSIQKRTTGLVDHIAFAVEDIEQEILRLKKLQINLADPEIRLLPSGKKIIFLYGPDGERIELVQHPS